MSIRARITLFGMAVVLAVLACFSGGIYGLLVLGVPGGQDQRLATRAAAAGTEIAHAPAADFTPSRPLAPVQPAVDDDMFVLVLDADGRPISYTGGHDPGVPAGLLDQARRNGTAKATVTLDGVPVRVAVQTWTRADLRTHGFVLAAQPVRRQVADLRGVLAVMLVCAFVTVVAAALAIWLVTRRALRPLRQLTTTADEIGRSPDRTRRLPPTGRRDDLGRLTESFNGMLDRLEEAHRRTAQALSAQQRFVADASHELRTPLTTIRNNAGFLRANPEARPEDRNSALADLDAEAVRMTRLIDDLLTLARADGGAPVKPSTVDIGALTHEICRQAGAQHPNRAIHCAGPPTVLRADADRAAASGSRSPRAARTRPPWRSPTTATASRRASRCASSRASTRPIRRVGRAVPGSGCPSPAGSRTPTAARSAPPTTSAAAPPSRYGSHRFLNHGSRSAHRPPRCCEP